MIINEPENLAAFNELLAQHKVCVVDFFATWCGPCKLLAAELSALTGVPNNVAIIKLNVDIDDFATLAGTVGVKGLPHVIFYKWGVHQNNIPLTGFVPTSGNNNGQLSTVTQIVSRIDTLLN